MILATAMYQPGLGWLTDIWSGFLWVSIALEILIILASLLMLARSSPYARNDEEKSLFMFCACLVMFPVSLLIGMGAWFACDSYWVGIGAALSANFASFAFIYCD